MRTDVMNARADRFTFLSAGAFFSFFLGEASASLALALALDAGLLAFFDGGGVGSRAKVNANQ
jgi:hypothetical protein